MAAIRNGAQANSQPYRSFLVRCWLEAGASPGAEPGGASAWRFTVQQAGRAGLRRSFACLHDVAAHIDGELEACSLPYQDRPKDESSTSIQHARKSEQKE